MNKSLIAGALCVLASLATPVLAAGDAEAGKTKSAVCAACHGADGKAIMAEYPNLAGQGAGYIVKQLQDFKEGRRENALMSPMAMPLSDEDMADLAAYYASLPAIDGVATKKTFRQGWISTAVVSPAPKSRLVSAVTARRAPATRRLAIRS